MARIALTAHPKTSQKRMELIETEDFCLSKYTIKSEKMSQRQGEGIHNDIFDRRFILRLYKETLLIIKKVKKFSFKMGKRREQTLPARGNSNSQYAYEKMLS